MKKIVFDLAARVERTRRSAAGALFPRAGPRGTMFDARVPGGVAVARTKVAGDVVIWHVEAPSVRADGSPARRRGTSSSITVAAPIDVIERLMAARLQGRLSLVRRRP